MNDKTDTCAHQLCDCPARASDGYCSDHCRDASAQPGPQQSGRQNCGCGHATCGRTMTMPARA